MILSENYKTISVVTPSFNQGAFIEETIQSVLSQEGDFFIDYLINDGGSDDDSVSIIRKYEKLLKDNCHVSEKMGLTFFVPRSNNFKWNKCLGISYRWVSEKDNGQVDAINKGLRVAKGDVLAYLNSDDVYYSGAFAKVLQKNWHKTDFVFGKGMWISEKGEDLLLYPTFKPTKYNLSFQCTLCQPTVFINRKVFEKLGGFSTRYHCVFDYEYWVRAVFDRKKFTFIKSMLAKSRMYRENKSLSGKDTVAKEMDELRKKYYYSPNSRMNRLRLLFSNENVQTETVNRVEKLEKLLSDEKECCKPECAAFSEKTKPGLKRRKGLKDDRINLVYDISVLGAGTVDQQARTGVYRFVENVMRGLKDSWSINLTLFSFPEYVSATKEYLKTKEELPSVRKIISESIQTADIERADIFHSPFFSIPQKINEITATQKFLTIHDLIPAKFPEFFTQKHITAYMHGIKSITPDTNILCNSHSTKNDLCNYLDFVDPGNVFVTHLAASSLFHPIEDQNMIETAKKKYHIPVHPYILGLSTLEPRKNIELTIRAFTDLICQEKIEDLNLVLVGGKGWNFDAIFKEVNLTPDVKERVFFTGFVEDKDLSAIYSGSMAFLYPSLYEGFGLPPLEAMQCGIPVITSDNSSLPEVVGDAGIMIDANDGEGLSHAVLDLYRSPGLRETMKKKSVKQAKKFSWERCTDETINAYEKALRKQRMFTPSMVDDHKLNIGINFTGLIPGKIGGMEKYMRAIVHYIPLLSDSHTLFVFLRSETMNEIQESKNVKKVCVRNTPAPDSVDGEIHQLITELDIHIWFSPLLILDPLNPGIPAVYCVPDIQHEYYPEFFSEDVLEWRHKYFEHSAKLADAIFTISDYSKMTLVEKYNVSPDKIHVTWLDCPTYFTIDKAFKHSEYVKTKYNLPGRYIFFPANTWPHKNHITLIKALESYHSCYGSPPDLVLTGYESDAHAELLHAIKNSVVKDKIHFLGYVDKDHMPAIYKNASCLVFPSMYEGFGIPLVEAMKTECPIIAANNTTMKEIAGDAAIYFDTMDEIELSVCIKYMLNEKRLGKKLIENGKKRAELFSFEKCVEETLRVMEDIYSTYTENQKMRIPSPN